MTFVLFMILTACSNESPFMGGESGMCRISLRLSPSPLPYYADNGTRSTEEGGRIENIIYSEDTKVCIFGNDNILQSIVYDGKVNDDALEIEGNGVCLNINLDFEKFSDGDILKVVIISNIDGFVDTSGSELKEGVTHLEDVKNMSLVLPVNQMAIDRIPMYGEKTLALSEIQNNGEENVSMNRMLAKIEVVDELQDNGYKIESVLLAGNEAYVVGNPSVEDIEFTNEGKIFRAYVPQRELGEDVKSDNRRITLNVRKSGSETTEPYHIFLSRYDENGEPVQDESEAWKTLLPNHLYRFTITSIKPVLQVQDKIAIVWYPGFYHGKFSNNWISLYDKNGKSYTSIEVAKVTGFKDSFVGYLADLSKLGCSYNELYYRFADGEYGNFISEISNLSEDVINIVEESDRTVFYLNAYSLADIYEYYSQNVYPTKHPYRFYCRRENGSKILIWDGNTVFTMNGKYESFKTDSRGYKYVQFNIKSGLKLHNSPFEENGFSFTIKDGMDNIIIDGDRLDDNAVFNQYDIFEQEIDGDVYYVFYLD